MIIEATTVGLDQLVLKLDAAAKALVGGGRAVVGNSAAVPYAKYVHDGTPPHVIEAKAGGALFWPGAEHPVRRVNHPGYKGNPYLTDALQAQQEAIKQVLGEAVTVIVETGAGSLDPALHAAGFLVEADAKGRANVGKTGNLRRDIHTEVYSR